MWGFFMCRDSGLNTFFQDIWSEVLSVIARAKARSNPAFAD
jgi:hypothetical protein